MVVVIKIGAYFMVLILYGCLLSTVYVKVAFHARAVDGVPLQSRSMGESVIPVCSYEAFHVVVSLRIWDETVLQSIPNMVVLGNQLLTWLQKKMMEK